MSLPFLLAAALCFPVAPRAGGAESRAPTFHEFDSTCIDLARYDAKTRELTVHFAGKHPERFYRYSKVPVAVWKKLQALNLTGGVGNYLNETVVARPEKHPFQEVTVRSFKTVPRPSVKKPAR